MKKIISLILSLSMVFVGAAFVSAEEIAISANHEIELLQNLDILSGYEDGSLKLDSTITRAEATKMIVAMLNKNAEGRQGTTKFADVPANHWASGYINIGVADGFINGKSDTSFDPEGQVKYNEIVKMIISCLGYNEYAQFYGGYPYGYITIADAEGISKDCSMDGEAYATRGTVSKLIYNALNTPIIQYKGMQHSATQGGFVPNIEKQDGEESKYYKSLLTERFDAYLVSGTVIANKKSEDTLDTDEVKISITKTEKYEIADELPTLAKVGNTNAADYLNTYTDMIIQKNEDDEYTILNIIPSGKNKIVETSLKLVDEDKSIDNYIWIFDSEDDAKSTKYKLESNYKLYVNGVENEEKDVNKYIINNKVGKIVLTDTYKSEDGYDIISVDYFETALVRSTSAKKIYIKSDTLESSLSIDADTLEEEEIIMNVYLGTELASVKDIAKDDILSIKRTNNFYDIYISRAYAEGRVSAKDPEEKTVTIDGYEYDFIDKDIFDDIKLGSEYKLRLDLFERIYDVEELASSTNYAIVLKTITSGNWDNIGLRMYLSNGTIKNYELSDKAAEGITNLGNAAKEDLVNRVVSYSVNSAGKIKTIDFKDGKEKTADFDERNSKIGNIILNNNTVVIDASEYKTSADLDIASVNTLVNDVEYTVYAFGESSKIDNSYPFVLVMNGKGTYTEDTRFAVVTKAPYASIKEDGEEGNMIEVLYEGSDDIQTFFIDEDTDYDTIDKGNVVVMRAYADGDIKEIKVIYNGEIAVPTSKWDTAWNTSKDMETSLIYGSVVEYNGRKYLAQIKDGKTYLDLEPTKDTIESEGAVLDIVTTQDTLVYVYDKNASKNNQYFVGTEDDIVTTQIDHLINDNEPFTIDWGSEAVAVNAFAKVVDGVITDIYVIIEKD